MYVVVNSCFLLLPETSVMEKTTMKHVYTEFYHQLVDAVSDPLTCQSLIAQLHSTTLISQEKIDQLSSGQHTGSSFLKVLGVEEDPQILTVLMEEMANVEQLQTLRKSMSTWLSTTKQGNGPKMGGSNQCISIYTAIKNLRLDECNTLWGEPSRAAISATPTALV